MTTGMEKMLADLQSAEDDIVRLLEIAANVTGSLGQEPGQEAASTEGLEAQVVEYIDLVKRIHEKVEPKIALLSAFEEPSQSAFASDLAARVAGAL